MMSGAEVKIVEKMLIELIVDMALPFNMPERPSFRRFVESIQCMHSRVFPVAHRRKLISSSTAQSLQFRLWKSWLLLLFKGGIELVWQLTVG